MLMAGLLAALAQKKPLSPFVVAAVALETTALEAQAV